MWRFMFLVALLGAGSSNAQDMEQPVSSSDGKHTTKDSLSFVSSSGPNTTTVATVKRLQRHRVRTIGLVIENLPKQPGNLSCTFAFANKSIVTEAIQRRNMYVDCTIPRSDMIALIPAGEHNMTAQLSLRSTNGSDFVSTSFVFFDCNSYSSCTACVSSPFPCDWCVHDRRCTHNTADENCWNDYPITGDNQNGMKGSRRGAGFCPAYVETSSGSQEILITDNSKK
uniref:Plexin-B n=1 Tax=Cacopsylla melanoneura TaxID=428564 RepID=A0A8D8WJG1_9HEMI